MKHVFFHPAAEIEFLEAVQFYEGRTPGLGKDLLEEIERSIETISTTPETFPKLRHDIRVCILWRFPFSIMYVNDPDQIRILAIAHQRRRPFYWQKRNL